jgi:hypothetical protein
MARKIASATRLCFSHLKTVSLQEAQDYATPARREMEAGAAMADVTNQFDLARQAAQDRLESFGIDPSQVRSGALDISSRVSEAAARAGAGNALANRRMPRSCACVQKRSTLGVDTPDRSRSLTVGLRAAQARVRRALSSATSLRVQHYGHCASVGGAWHSSRGHVG